MEPWSVQQTAHMISFNEKKCFPFCLVHMEKIMWATITSTVQADSEGENSISVLLRSIEFMEFFCGVKPNICIIEYSTKLTFWEPFGNYWKDCCGKGTYIPMWWCCALMKVS